MFRPPVAAVLCAAALCSSALAQGIDNSGREFLVAFMPNTINGNPDVELHLTSSVATTATVEYPAFAPVVTLTANLVPGAISIVTLPVQASTAWTADSIGSNLVRAHADDPFVVYAINRKMFSSDAALALPIETLNTEYIVLDYSRAILAQMVVYAAYDDTEVTILPAVDMTGHAAGVPFTVSLDAGQAYFGTSTATTGMTGTRVSADRPVGLANGNFCANVPSGVIFCDHLYEVAQPVQTWASDVLAVNLPQRPQGSIYRVVASVDGTTLEQNGTVIGTLDAGQFLELGPLPGSQRFSADAPIFVCQYLTGSSSPGAFHGDPSQGNVIPPEQYRRDYTFSTVGGSQFANHFLTIIAANSDVGSLLLDGAPVPATEYTAIVGSGYSSAVLPLAEGTHVTSSASGHGITVSGFNDDDSYLYPGGARFNFINPVGDANAPLCDLTVAPDRTSAAGELRDDRPSEDVNMNGVLDPGEDLNGNGMIDEDTGIFQVTVEPGASNLTVQVATFAPGAASVGFTAALTSPTQAGTATLRFSDGAGNETLCPIELEGVFRTYCFGTSCPCGNDDPGAGCANSTNAGALLEAVGSSSLAADDLTLNVSGLPPQRFGIVYYGPDTLCGPFGDGLRAVAPGPPGVFDRRPHRNSGATGAFTEGPGLASAIGAQVGTTLNFQVLYRDKDGPCGSGFNLSNGISVSFLP